MNIVREFCQKKIFSHIVWMKILVWNVFLFLTLLCALVFWFFIPYTANSATRYFTIPSGTPFSVIAYDLERMKLVANRWVFQMNVFMAGHMNQLKAGEYRIPAQSSMFSIMTLLYSGQVVLHPVTIPEGLTSQQIVSLLLGNDLLTGDMTEVPLEGTLLPETYMIPRGLSYVKMIDHMQSSMQKTLDELWEKRIEGLPFENAYEALILASIVEKETGLSAERPLVASVFINRLHNNILLQSDPTIIYGLVGGKGTLNRAIRLSEMKKKTPFNTYIINGLPPTPIVNPGKQSIEAVLNPHPNKDLFYFVADGKGGHIFSKTLVEHNKNVLRWKQMNIQ